MEFNDLLHLLQPAESEWDSLAPYLISDHEVTNIKVECCRSNASDKALVEVIKRWSRRTVREHRTWQTLRTVAEKCGDNTISQFLQDNKLSGKHNNAMHNIMLISAYIG